MTVYALTETKARWLKSRMDALGIREEDLKERFMRAGGPGGQNVNKVATRVSLRHLPTGIEVRMQRERSQAVNRFLARCLLVERVEAARRALEAQERQRLERLRRRTRRRPQHVRERILASKRLRSLKKQARRRPPLSE